MLAEPTVLKPCWLSRYPYQSSGQAHAGPAQLGMHPGPIGQWLLISGHHGCRWKQPALQLRIKQDGGPGEVAGSETVEAVADSDTTARRSERGLTCRQALKFETQHFANLTHGYTLHDDFSVSKKRSSPQSSTICYALGFTEGTSSDISFTIHAHDSGGYSGDGLASQVPDQHSYCQPYHN